MRDGFNRVGFWPEPCLTCNPLESGNFINSERATCPFDVTGGRPGGRRGNRAVRTTGRSSPGWHKRAGAPGPDRRGPSGPSRAWGNRPGPPPRRPGADHREPDQELRQAHRHRGAFRPSRRTSPSPASLSENPPRVRKSQATQIAGRGRPGAVPKNSLQGSKLGSTPSQGPRSKSPLRNE